MNPSKPTNLQEALRESEERFRLLVETISDYAIFMLDPDGHVVSWNAGAEAVKGYRPDEIVGEHFSRFYPEEDVQAGKPARLLQAALAEGRAEDEGWRVRKDGSRFWASVMITPLRDERGGLVGFAKVTRDLTERRLVEERLLESEERSRLFIESVKDCAIYMLDQEGHVVSWNAGAQNLTGYHAEEIVGQHFSRFYPPEDVESRKPSRELEIATREGRVEDEGWRLRKDGSRFWVHAAISAIRDAKGRLLGFGKVVRDLTQRRRDDEELARYNAELETFSYTVSHDLRAPLRAIDGFAEILVQDHAGSLVPEARRQLLVIRDKAKQMSLLIDGLLNLARLGRLAVTRAPVDMHALAVSVYAELRGTVPEGREPPDLRLHPLPQALGDATLLRQVLANLFTNAFKFTRGRPKARVEIGAEQDGNQVTYHVKDNGTGFDMKDADRLFRVFSRLESAGEVEGTGIGLALVQRIVQRHGGRVWADGRPGEGATFFFNLPRA